MKQTKMEKERTNFDEYKTMVWVTLLRVFGRDEAEKVINQIQKGYEAVLESNKREESNLSKQSK
jgi:hypothetical protein